jgi:hypothetical protein
MPSYKLTVNNAKVILKTMANYIINLTGIKDNLTGTGNVTNGKIDWTLQDFTNTASWFTTNNPVLLLGQKAIETDDLLTAPKFKIGNGVTDWNSLPYFSSGGGSGAVETVTGTNVDNTDPLNPIIDIPNLEQITALTVTITNPIQTESNITVYEPLPSIDVAVTIDADGIYIVNDSNTNNLFQVDRVAGTITKNGVDIATVNDIPTVDTTIIDGSTNPVDGNAVFDALALKAPLASPTFTGTVNLSGNTASRLMMTDASKNIVSTGLFVTPEMFNANAGDGTTDSSAAIQSCIDSGFAVCLTGGRNYRISTEISITDSRYIFGTGEGAKISTATNIVLFRVTGNNNNFFNLKLEGAVSGGSGATNFGIWADGVAGLTSYRINNKVSNCSFTNLYYGVATRNMVGTSSATKHEGAFAVSDCSFTGCLAGFIALGRGEYNTITNCKFYGNTTGVSFTGGNNSITGGTITDNTTGISVLSGTNDGHSSATGVMINHNTTNINCTHTLGYLFNGCMIYAGSVTLTGTGKTVFLGCWFSMSTYTLTITNSPVYFNNCEFVVVPTTYTLTGTAPIMNKSYSGASKLLTPTTTTTNTELINNNNLSDVGSATTSRNNILPSKTGNSLKVLRVNAGETDYELATISGGSGITRSINIGQSGSVSAGATASTDYVYIFTGLGTLTLPTAVGNTNQYTVKNSHSANITVDFTSGQNADGSTSITIVPNQSLDFISNNSNYIII